MTETAIKARACRSCGVLVYDLIHEGTRRPAPIEVDPNAEGNIAIDLSAGTYRVTGRELRHPDRIHYRSHFASCPAAEKYRAGRPLRGR
jgi:hypothetical protein